MFNGQYRNSSYDVNGNGVSNSFNTDTYGLQLTWAPTSDISFRGQYQRAVRAPTLLSSLRVDRQDFLSWRLTKEQAFLTFLTPCSTANPVASAAACANTGVTAAQYGSVPDIAAGQTQGVSLVVTRRLRLKALILTQLVQYSRQALLKA